MQEVIAKSKFNKLERQKQNEEVQSLAAEVDADLDNIRALIGATVASDAAQAAAAAAAAAASTQAGSEGDELVDGLRKRRAPLPSQNDNYDRFVKELVVEARAAPSDRLKTEEEMAAEEKSMLENMEVTPTTAPNLPSLTPPPLLLYY